MSQSSPLSYSSRLSRHHTRRVLLAIVLATGVLIVLIDVLLVASCPVFQLYFVSDTENDDRGDGLIAAMGGHWVLALGR
jgi:hypothetical protein